MRQYIQSIFIALTASVLISCGSTSVQEMAVVQPEELYAKPKMEFGIPTDRYEMVKGVIRRNEFLADILLGHQVDYSIVHEIAMKSKEVFDVRKLASGRPYTVFLDKDSSKTARLFVYQPNDLEYVIYDFSSDSVKISMHQKDVEYVKKCAEGRIETSLYDALKDQNNNILLAFEMADIFAWTIDFYRLQKGDGFTIFYTERQVDGKFIGIAEIHAVLFQHEGRDFYAYHFTQDSVGSDYFDEEAESLRKAFLKSPLKYSRLSSGFTRRRFHPVQKRWKAHLGTDYAAPRGTPIMATGDGVIIEARFKKYNGNYVKIRHNSVYNTQYLHMSKIKSGIKPGAYVKQGDVIGYVGSTGLATGPHVCYRFWKNGGQVNHLKEDFPPSEPVSPENLERFYEHIKPLKERLDLSQTPS